MAPDLGSFSVFGLFKDNISLDRFLRIGSQEIFNVLHMDIHAQLKHEIFNASRIYTYYIKLMEEQGSLTPDNNITTFMISQYQITGRII